ncbi:hypothetical protein STEG23_021428, partial [Scotinomys teguina]
MEDIPTQGSCAQVWLHWLEDLYAPPRPARMSITSEKCRSFIDLAPASEKGTWIRPLQPASAPAFVAEQLSAVSLSTSCRQQAGVFE